MQGGKGSGKACDYGFGRPGRREVGEMPSENPSFDRCTGKVGVHDPPSSPASPTKEKHRNRKISVLFLAFMACFWPEKVRIIIV